MRTTLSRLPILVLMAGASGVAMLAPAFVALLDDDHPSARTFLYTGLLVMVVTGLIAIATHDRPNKGHVRDQLLAVMAALLLMPIVMAIPFYESLRNTFFINAWFEMVSMFTTTGATLYDAERLSSAEHLWRAIVAWGGGLFTWSVALSIYAPLHLGGYEIAMTRTSSDTLEGKGGPRPVADRFTYAVQTLAPTYFALTAALFCFCCFAGERTVMAAILAMGTLSTTGLLPTSSLEGVQTGRWAEAAILIFFLFAFSRATFTKGVLSDRDKTLAEPELKLATIIALIFTLTLFLRHFIGALEVERSEDILGGLRALWGAFFTVISFLSTTGYVSGDWEAARAWSGLPAPGLILMGLAFVGGGVATTAGGVKLLRVYALIKHGQREIGRLVYPSSIGGAGSLARYIRREGAFIAWVVFMLLVIAMAGVMVGLAAFGITFEDALILTIASLTNTGPLATHAAAEPVDWIALPNAAKVLLGIAMVLGRMEMLALIALFNPDFWRK